MKLFKHSKLKAFTGKGYALTPVELKDQVPFEVKRMYSIIRFETLKIETGQHCHKIEEEAFIQVQGRSILILDRGKGKEDMEMQEGDIVYVPNYVWHGFKNVSPDGVIIALSSTNYMPDRNDYVEDYGEYLKFRDEKLLNQQNII